MLRSDSIRNCLALGLAVLVSALAGSPALQAETLRVPSQYPTIQAAVNAANTGDEVVVADGRYTGDGNRDVNFLGKAITVRSESGNPDACIIDCEGSEPDPHIWVLPILRVSNGVCPVAGVVSLQSFTLRLA